MPNTLYHPQNLCPATPRCIIHLSYVSPDSSKLSKKEFDHVLDLKRNIGEPSSCRGGNVSTVTGLFLLLMELSLLGFRSWKQERDLRQLKLAGKDVINKLNRKREKCGERGSNTRPSDLQSDALPTELSPPACCLFSVKHYETINLFYNSCILRGHLCILSAFGAFAVVTGKEFHIGLNFLVS